MIIPEVQWPLVEAPVDGPKRRVTGRHFLLVDVEKKSSKLSKYDVKNKKIKK